MSASGKHSNEDDFLNYVHVIRLFYVLNMGMPTLNNCDQNRIYHDEMYCNIDVGDHSSLFPGSSQGKASQSNVIIIWISCFRGQLL